MVKKHFTTSKQGPNQTGFTLVEMVIVFAIISLLIAVVIQGSLMIGAARFNSAKSFTAKAPIPHIDGLIAWYETTNSNSFKSAESYDGAQLTEWRDISPNSLTTQRNSPTRTASSAVTYVAEGINKVPSVKFDGTGNLTLSSFYQGALSQYTIFLVFSPLSSLSSSAKTVFDSGSSTTTSIGLKNDRLSLNAGTALDTSALNNSGGFYINNSYIIAIYFNGSSSQAFVNDITTSVGSALISIGSNQLNGFTIGTARAASSNGLNGLVSEVIIYNRPIKSIERRDIFKYLSEKYGITVNNL